MTRSPDLSGPRIHAFHPSSVRGSSRRIPRASCGGERPRGTAPHGRRPRPRAALGRNARRAAHARVRVDREAGFTPLAYGAALLAFNVLGFLALFLMLRFQGHLPINPTATPDMPWVTALHTAASCVTNTNQQFYAGETAVSALTQTAGLLVQNVLSAATGIAPSRLRSSARSRSGARGRRRRETPPSPSGTPGGTCCASSFGCCSLWACSSGWASW